MSISTRIRELRYIKGWGPDELASRAKISRTALYQIERGNTTKPQASTLKSICRALGVPLENLLESSAPAASDGPGVTVSIEPPILGESTVPAPKLAGVVPASLAAIAGPNLAATVPVSLPVPHVAMPMAFNRSGTSSRGTSSDRADELMEKFRLLLCSPLAEGVARMVRNLIACTDHPRSVNAGGDMVPVIP